ncbi:MAG: hypothetical protein ACRDGR_02135, partial [bacterium]
MRVTIVRLLATFLPFVFDFAAAFVRLGGIVVSSHLPAALERVGQRVDDLLLLALGQREDL